MTVIRVGARPANLACRARFYDGRQARPLVADVAGEERAAVPGLVIRPEAGAVRRWPLAAIRRVRDEAARDRMTLTAVDDPGARLVLTDPEDCRVISARCPDLDQGLPVRGRGRLVLWALAAIGSIALILFVLMPALADRLAPLLPPRGEAALGDAALGQIRAALGDEDGPVPICRGEAGAAALAAMTDRLTGAAALPVEPRVVVLDHDAVNAFALPGGHVALFRGLIEAAEAPGEVAAVLAHEMGHVAARDPVRIALRSAGSAGILGLLFGDFAGGAAILLLSERIIQAGYTQRAEASADAYAAELMARAGLSPSALSDFFSRLAEEQGEPPAILEHFLAHPNLGDRIEAVPDAPAAGPPALTGGQWRALRGICAD